MLDPRWVPDNIAIMVHIGNLLLVPMRSKHAPTTREVLVTKTKLARSSPWVTSFILPHDSLGVGERGFGQVVTQLHRLTRPIYQHAIKTFSTCSRGPTHRSLTDIGRGYKLEGAGFSHHTPPTFPTDGLHFWPKGPTRSQVIHPTLPTRLKEDQTLNLTSGSLHSTSIATYHLSIVLLMVSHQEIGLTRVIRNVTHNASTAPYNSYKHNAQTQ
jgi:hypothetical protein